MQTQLGFHLARVSYMVTTECHSHVSCKFFTLQRSPLTILCNQLRLDYPFPPIPYTPFQLHALAMATFASLVAPFGGFFASGFKRAFDIKDFGDSIPGHGGMTDRMDCQYVFHFPIFEYQRSEPSSVPAAPF